MLFIYPQGTLIRRIYSSNYVLNKHFLKVTKNSILLETPKLYLKSTVSQVKPSCTLFNGDVIIPNFIENCKVFEMPFDYYRYKIIYSLKYKNKIIHNCESNYMSYSQFRDFSLPFDKNFVTDDFLID